MTLEDLITAHLVLKRLSDRQLLHLLDLIEDPANELPVGELDALHLVLLELARTFGGDCPAARQFAQLLAAASGRTLPAQS